VPELAATVVVWTLGEMISSPVAGAYVSHLAPERYRGRYMGLLMLMWSIGMVLGPSIGTYVFERNETALWTACGVLAVLGATFAMMSRGKGSGTRDEGRGAVAANNP
jgi:MFS family permease